MVGLDLQCMKSILCVKIFENESFGKDSVQCGNFFSAEKSSKAIFNNFWWITFSLQKSLFLGFLRHNFYVSNEITG